MKKTRVQAYPLVIALVLISGTIGISSVNAAPPGEESGLGPLSGRNVYAPHLPWFSFTADSAAALPEGSIRVGTAFYILNEFSSYPFDPDDYTLEPDGRLSAADQDELTAMDYESTVWELSIDWQAMPSWSFGADWRLHARYGGSLDNVIEWWHNVLGVSNAGREYYSHNRSNWNIKSSTGSALTGEGVVIGAGDLDINALWSFWSSPKLTLAAGGAFKIPIGQKVGGFSSGYPDIAAEFLLDWRPWTRWIFYLNTGIIMPLGGEGRLMGQFIPAVEFRAAKGLSILVQMNIQSSPITGTEAYIHPLFGRTTMFTLPQTDLKIGLKGRSGRFGWQFYIEEDPITWEGPDILLYFGADWIFK